MKIYKLQVVYSELDGVHKFYFGYIEENQYTLRMFWIFFYLGKLFPNNYKDRFLFFPYERSRDLFDVEDKVIARYSNHQAKNIADKIWKRIQKIVGYNNKVVHYQNTNHKRVTMCGIRSYNKINCTDELPEEHRLCKKCTISYRVRLRKLGTE